MPKRRQPAQISGVAGSASPHDSARKHVSGEAIYIDDMPEPAGLLHLALGLSTMAHARIRHLDLADVRAAAGVIDVMTAAHVPGLNDISATHSNDEPLLAHDIVEYVGQPLFAVAALSRTQARAAARLALVEYEALPAVIDIAAARAKGQLVSQPLTLARGDAASGLAGAQHRIAGRMNIGGQEHFYLEGQIALAMPGEDAEMTVHSSTQHPSEVQAMVAHVLGVPAHAVTVETRRMGGGFGGKETQANLFACIAAIIARRTGRAAKIRPDRDDDMIITGKRHDFSIDYDVGFDANGKIAAASMVLAARCGFSADLSGPVTDRALFHADNCYFYPDVRLASLPLKTNTASNTAFRGFGGPQGMVAAERLIEEIAFATGLDALDVRQRNFYGTTERNITPYHQTLSDNIIAQLVARLEASACYRQRRAEIGIANAQSRVIKRGLALTPVKFGISFTATHFNQAGALLHIYTDGSIQLNHGGTEMGQGLHVKVAQVVAQVFQVELDRIKITPTNTGKVPNTSATAASSGADLNGRAAQAAALILRQRLTDFAAERWQVHAKSVQFVPGGIEIGEVTISFADLVRAAYLARVSLSANGFYRTPKIHWDRKAGRGRPFYYFAYGAAVSEVAIDTLTGEYRVLRADILHDAGQSLNPAIDIGQIEGGFVQGMGWLTTEELVWDSAGHLKTHAPSTYKIPACGDRPQIFNVTLLEHAPNSEDTVFRSKAVGEPPLMLGMSVFFALSDAVASVAAHRICPRLDAPATPERVLEAVMRLRASQ